MHARVSLLLTLALVASSFAADPPDIRELKLREWEPKSMMVTKTTIVEKPMFPVIDIHNHLGTGKATLTPQRVERYLTEMNEAGVRTVVNLDGMWGDRLKETIAALDTAHPGRFLTFAQINFDGLDDDDWGLREGKRLEESFQAGARGLKFHKTFGLHYRFKNGELLKIDDPRLDPVWETCATHNRPVVIHIADPAAFFTPLDRFNERWHELNTHSNWLFFGEKFPKRQDLLDQLHRVIAKHPKTAFVNTHFGNNVEDLAAVADKLDKYPNMYVDIDARISELGRQPYTARKFFLKYQDRIMFGTDTTPRRDAFRIYYRFLETDDEYFDCSASHHLQGFWRIYGIYLPKDVLEKVYRSNAERILGIKTEPVKPAMREMRVRRTEDFEVSGSGSAEAWKHATWQALNVRGGKSAAYESRFKMLYSKTGVYVLFHGADSKLTATLKDGGHLWTEDVYELFLQPDEKQPTYFEYEISPLGSELSLMVTHSGGKLLRWQPWIFEEGAGRKTRKQTSSSTSAQGEIASWTAEVFVPYALLQPLENVPPKPGTRWRANFYRMDYDDGKAKAWDWSRVGSSFHEYQKFGTLVFE
jgi:predicted TIM-barrel fold metal-dependent hydrolase